MDAKIEIHFNGDGEEFEKKMKEGSLIPLAVYFYDATADNIHWVCMRGRTKEETIAMLRKHGCFPEPDFVVDSDF